MKSFKTKKGTDYSKWLIPLLVITVLFVGMMFFVMYSSPYLEKFTNSSATLEYYYMQSCPHCNNFTPVWEELGRRVKNEGISVSLKKYDLQAPENKVKVDKNKITGAPTIILEKNGKSTEYHGNRSVEGLLTFIQY
jgi:glutaredoxin